MRLLLTLLLPALLAGVTVAQTTQPLGRIAPPMAIVSVTADAIDVQPVKPPGPAQRFKLGAAKVFLPDVIDERRDPRGRYIPVWDQIPGTIADLKAGQHVRVTGNGDQAEAIHVLPANAGARPTTQPSILRGKLVSADAKQITIEFPPDEDGQPGERLTFRIDTPRIVQQHVLGRRQERGRTITKMETKPGSAKDPKPGSNVRVYREEATVMKVGVEIEPVAPTTQPN